MGKEYEPQPQRPEIALVDIGDDTTWPALEQFYITSYRAAGFALVNGCDGGLGTLSPTEEARVKISNAFKGRTHSAEAKAKMSRAAMGRKWPPRTAEHSDKISNALNNHPVSQEVREKISKKVEGKDA